MHPSRPRFPRRLSAIFMATALLAGSIQTATAADPTHRVDASQLSKAQVQPAQAGGVINADIDKAAQKDGKVSIIVKLNAASVASYTGTVKGLSATNPELRGQTQLDLKGTDAIRYRSYLKVKQDAFTKQLDANVKGAKVTARYDLVLNAVSVIVPADKVTAVAKLPGVAAVYPDTLLKLQTDTSPAFIGAPTIWSQLGGQESSGQGVIVGVLDTGIWPEHPSFSDPDPSGKPYAAPPAPLSGSRGCEFGSATPGDPAFACNNKLIGAERHMDTYDAFGPALDPGEFLSARDDDGHGTHTSSTAAGNAGVAASIFGIARGTISGIAPRAHVEMFKVCGAEGCFGSDSISGIQAAIADGVNVINFSISGGANPYSDAVELAFLDAYNAGVFVAASAGNSGPVADTTDHRGPWVTTVAASTTSRAFVDTVHVTATSGATLNLAGVSLTAGVGPAPIVVNPDEDCSDEAAPGTFTGQIVICKRGNPPGRVVDGYNVLQGGAVGMILYNASAASTDQETDNHFLPVSHIQFAQGQALVAFLGSHTGEMATISVGVKGTQQGDVMASFSSRGGPGQTLGVSKPDITAPGVQILAGASPLHVGLPSGPDGELFQSIAGTSMSSPHIAGAAALVRDLHPAWSPGQIKSALMTTAKTAGLVKENGTTPANAFDAGSGRVDLRKAGDPGLTFDATGAEFLAWEDQLYRVNQPSIYHPNMPGVIQLTRTVRSVMSSRSDWRITTSSPSDLKISVVSSIVVGARAEKTFSITLDANRVPLGQTRFGVIKLTQTRGGNRVLHIPVTIVRGQAAVTLTQQCAPTTLANNQKTTCTITATNPSFENVTYQIKETLHDRLRLIKSSVVGATWNNSNGIEAHGTLLAAQPPDVDVAYCALCSPAGYLPLSDPIFDPPIDPEGGFGDETIVNYTLPSFEFAGESWDTIGFVSNGYAVVGGGTGADVEFINQTLPDAAPPNNVLAPFWTDLDAAADTGGGELRIAILGGGGFEWLVLDWEAVQEYANATPSSFQIWIGLNGVEDITYTYGDVASGDGGLLTVGAENKFGNRGDTVYVDGSGTIPEAGDEVLVSSTPGVVQTKVITLKGKNIANGKWRNCATLTSNAFLGTSYACARGLNR